MQLCDIPSVDIKRKFSLQVAQIGCISTLNYNVTNGYDYLAPAGCCDCNSICSSSTNSSTVRG